MKKLSFALALAVALIASQAFAIPPAGSGKQSAAKAGSMNNVVNQAIPTLPSVKDLLPIRVPL